MAVTGKSYTGSGVLATTDYKTAIRWQGKTKSGSVVSIILKNAVNIGNLNLSMAEKDDIVPEVVFTATYDNTDATASATTEPWEIDSLDSSVSGANSIVLGTGVFYIGNNAVALCRGGGSFAVEREFRQINADGDRGPVKGRIVMESSTATLTMNALTWLASMSDLFPAVTEGSVAQ